MKRSRLIPFRFTPASWGLNGQPYEEAEIAYMYEGAEMDTRLAKLRITDGVLLAKALLAIELQYNTISKYDADRRMLDIDGKSNDPRAVLDVEFSHGKIGEFEYGRSIIEIEKDGVEKDVALLDHDLSHGRIEVRAHAKAVASARKIPWVGIVDDEFNPNLGLDGFSIELDWNEEWVTYLKMNGYVGRSEADIIDAWFVDVCGSAGEQDVRLADDPIVPFPTQARRTGPMPRNRT